MKHRVHSLGLFIVFAAKNNTTTVGCRPCRW